MKKCVMLLATLGLLLCSTTSALAFGHRKAHCAPPSEAPCGYQYVTEYRTVTKTICTYEAVTNEVEFTEHFCVPVTTTENQTQTYYEAQQRVVPQTRTVYRCEYETRKAKVAVMRPVTKNVEYSYQVCVPKYNTVKRTSTYMVPVPKVVERSYLCTVYDTVPVKKTCQVCTYTPVTTCAPAYGCGPCGSRGVVSTCYVPSYKTVEYTAYQSVPRTVEKKYNVTVCEYKQESKEYNVTVCTYEYKTEKKTVPVTTCETDWVEKEFQVPVMKPHTENYNVTVCEMVSKTRTVPVTFTRYEMKTKNVKRPVTTYKPVYKTVEVKVPVTVCVPCAPVCP
jgi:hypothetical protein